MFLKNSFYLFLIPLCFLFCYYHTHHQKQEQVYTMAENKMVQDTEEQLSLEQMKNLKVLDTFSLEKKDGTYFYKVIQKFYTKDIHTVKVNDSSILFGALVDNDLHLILIAIHTGKLVKN